MIAAWMLYSIAVTALLCVAGAAADGVCAALRLPRRWSWLAAMMLSLLVSAGALISLLSGSVEAVPPASAALEQVASPGSEWPAADFGARTSAVLQRAYAGAAAVSDRLAAALWLGASAVLLFTCVAALVRLRRMRAGWRTHRIAGTTVLISRDIGPALIGFRAPAVVLPAWLLLESADRQRMIVQHEVEHLCARDHAMLAASCLALCLMPWNIGAWWLFGRTRLAVELDCDTRVLRRGAAAALYGAMLVDVIGRAHSRWIATTALTDSRTHLERRLIAMTERRGNPNRLRMGSAAAAATLLTVVACTTDLPTASAQREEDVEQVESKPSLFENMLDGGGMFRDARFRQLRERRADAVEFVATREDRDAEGLVLEGELRLRTEAVPFRGADPELMIELRSSDGTHEPLTVQARTIELTPGSTPLIIFDGIVAESLPRGPLSADQIERIELLEAEAAGRLTSDPRAANGIIRITSRKGGS